MHFANQQVPTWTHADCSAGDCYAHEIGTAKPPGFARLQFDCEDWKRRAESAEKQLASKQVDPAVVKELTDLRAQLADLQRQLAGADEAAERRLHDKIENDQQRVRKALQRIEEQKAIIDADRAGIAAEKAAIAQARSDIAEASKEQQATKRAIAEALDKIREREANMVKIEGQADQQQTVGQRQQAILNGDLSSVTLGLVADIARLEADVEVAHKRMQDSDKGYDQLKVRQHWSSIYVNAAKELRAARQQLIDLPRPGADNQRRWQDRMTELLADLMSANVPRQTLIEFVGRMTGTLANREVQRAVVDMRPKISASKA